MCEKLVFACLSPFSRASVFQKHTDTGKLKNIIMILAQDIEGILYRCKIFKERGCISTVWNFS